MLYLHTPTNILVTRLALSDVLVGATVIPLLVFAEAGVVVNKKPTSCLVAICTTVVHVIVSSLIVIFIVIEQYISIRSPTRHRIACTIHRTSFTVALCWVYGVCAGGVLPQVEWNDPSLQRNNETLMHDDGGVTLKCRRSFIYLLVGHFVLMWLVVTVLYARIYLLIRDHQTVNGDIAMHSSVICKPSSVRATNNITTSQTEIPMKIRSIQRYCRAQIVVFLVVVIFMVAWMPLVTWYSGLSELSFSTSLITSPTDAAQSFVMDDVAAILGFSNAAVMPILYGFGNHDVRSAFVKAIACLNRHQNGD